MEHGQIEASTSRYCIAQYYRTSTRTLLLLVEATKLIRLQRLHLHEPEETRGEGRGGRVVGARSATDGVGVMAGFWLSPRFEVCERLRPPDLSTASWTKAPGSGLVRCSIMSR